MQNICAKCKQKIEGSFGYDPQTERKYHFPCWVEHRKEQHDKVFTPTLFPTDRYARRP